MSRVAVKSAEDEKAALIRDIRSRLPFVAVGHPKLAAEIREAMDLVTAAPAEPDRTYVFGAALRKLADITATDVRVGTVVYIVTSEDGPRKRLGIVVQVGDEDDGHEGTVLVHMEDGPGYPCWWASWIVVPVALFAKAIDPTLPTP